MSRLLVVRPEPGASATAARAASLGWAVTIAPIFIVRPLDWTPPEEAVDALMLTSANAARHAGTALGRYRDLPVHAVGTATSAAAHAAGLRDVRTGGPDSAALVATLGDSGRVLHLAGREHEAALPPGGLRRIVYASEALPALPDAAYEALTGQAIVLLHSARAARHLRVLLDLAGINPAGMRVGALSPAVAAAATGWRDVAIAARPDDDALIAAVAGWR